MWKDAVMAYFKALSPYAPGGTEETTTVAGFPIEIRNVHLQNTSQTRCHLSQLAGSGNFWPVQMKAPINNIS
jgi:hypothetical protein